VRGREKVLKENERVGKEEAMLVAEVAQSEG